MKWSNTVVLCAGFLVTLGIAGCSEQESTLIPKEALLRLVVSPKTSNLIAIGDSVVLKAGTLDLRTSQVGHVEKIGTPSWQSLDPDIVTVDADGVVRAQANGLARVLVTAGGRADTATIVIQQEPAEVTLSPTDVFLDALGDTARLELSAIDRNGHPMTVTQAYWQSLDPEIGTIDNTGLVTALKPGTMRVRARVSDVTDAAMVEIQQSVAAVAIYPETATSDVGTIVPLSGMALDRGGSEVQDAEITWETSDEAVATVSERGEVTTVAPGTATITARSRDRSDRAEVRVREAPAGGLAPVSSVTLSPATANVLPGRTVQLIAVLKDEDNNILAGRPINWSSSASSVATVSTSGLVTSIGPGSTTIRAISGDKVGSSLINVSAPLVVLRNIEVDPATATLQVGGALQLAATVRDTSRTVVNGLPITWNTSNANVATVDATGRVVAVATGQATISARVDTKTDAAVITVAAPASVPAQVGSVTVGPNSVSLTAGATTSLIATVKDTTGAVMTNQTVTWTSSNTAVATVSAAGVVTAVGAGSATITASCSGKTGQSGVTVTSPTTPTPSVGSVTVSPANSNLSVSGTAQLTATVKDLNGATMSGQTVTWTSSAPAVASVSSAGKVTALAAGSTTITASAGGKSGNATVNVAAPAALASISVTPAAVTVAAGSSVLLQATARDASGNVLNGYTFTFTSSNNNIASVTTNGAVLGVSSGLATITVSAGGKTAQSQVNVTPPITINGVVFQDNFESGAYKTGQIGGRWVGGNSGNVHVGSGGANGSAWALSMTHKGKLPGSMSSAEQRFKLTQGAKELWIEYDFMVPTNFYHRQNPTNAENNKFLALWEENYTGVANDGVTPTPLLVFEFRPMKTGEVGSSYVYLHGTDRTGKIHGNFGSRWSNAFGSWNRGKWIQIRVHVKLASNDNTDDGFVLMYADGVLVTSAQQLPLHSSASGHYIRQGYLMGWANSGYDADTEFKIDNVKFYMTSPGW